MFPDCNECFLLKTNMMHACASCFFCELWVSMCVAVLSTLATLQLPHKFHVSERASECERVSECEREREGERATERERERRKQERERERGERQGRAGKGREGKGGGTRGEGRHASQHTSTCTHVYAPTHTSGMPSSPPTNTVSDSPACSLSQAL